MAVAWVDWFYFYFWRDVVGRCRGCKQLERSTKYTSIIGLIQQHMLIYSAKVDRMLNASLIFE